MSEHTARHPRPLPSLQCVQRGPQVYVDGQAVPVGGQGRGGEGVPAGTAKEGKGVKDRVSRPRGYYSHKTDQRHCGICKDRFWDIDSVVETSRGLVHEWCHPDYRPSGENFKLKVF
jgi:hypothetical protein